MSFDNLLPRETYVHVVRIERQLGVLGNYKRLTLIEQLGFWHDKIYCHIFPSSDMYERIEKGTLLKVKVTIILVCQVPRLVMNIVKDEHLCVRIVLHLM